MESRRDGRFRWPNIPSWPNVVFWPGVALAVGGGIAWLPLPSAVLLVGGTAVFLLTLMQPLVGLAAALLVGPLGAYEALFRAGPFDSGQLLLFFTLTAWIAGSWRDRWLYVPRIPLLIPLAGLISIGLVSVLRAPSFDYGFKEVAKWGEIALVMVMVVACGRGNGRAGAKPKSSLAGYQPPHAVWWVAAILLLAGVSQGVLGLWQFGLAGDGPDHFLISGRFYRAYGTFQQPNPFGGFMNLTALLGMGMLLGGVVALWQEWQAGWRRGNWRGVWGWLLVGGGTAVTSAALIASWSRGAWMGFAAGLLTLVLFFPRQRGHGVALLGLAGLLGVSLLLAGVVPATLVDRFTTGLSDDFRLGDVRGTDINDANYAVLERLAHWQAALAMANDHPWLGVGFGNYEPAYPAYRLINWPDALGHAHNYYLNLLAEVGVVGLLAYLLLWAVIFGYNVRLLHRLVWPYRGLALGLLAAWVALSVHHLVDKLYVNNLYIHLGAMCGLLFLLDES